MKNKLRIILFLLSLSIIIAIAYVGWVAPKAGLYDFLIAAPKISGDGIPIKKLEEVNENKVTLTYENIYDKSVKTLQSNHNIALKGTNASYPYVMNFSITYGGFFTKKAMDDEHKYAVLNEKAAFDIFGTLDAVGNEIQIDLTPYIVVGVIDDEDTDNMNVFIPASYFAESTEAVVINLAWDNGLTEEYIKNELKHIGINELKYDFINHGLVSKAIKNNVFVSMEIALFGLVLLFIKKSVVSVCGHWKEFTQKNQESYFTELLRNETKLIKKLLLWAVSVTCLFLTGFVVILDLFERYLEWNSIRKAFSDINYTSFAIYVAEAEKLYFMSNALIVGFIIVFVIFMITVWNHAE